MYHWLGHEDLCAEVILNGAGNQTGGHWSATEWDTNPARLEALVAAGPPDGPKYVMAPQPLLPDNCYGSAEVSLSYHNPDHSHCTTSQYFGVYIAGGDAITVRNNDCRACSRSNSSRICMMLGGNTSNVEQSHNSGDWSTALKSDDNEFSKRTTTIPPPQGWVGVCKYAPCARRSIGQCTAYIWCSLLLSCAPIPTMYTYVSPNTAPILLLLCRSCGKRNGSRRQEYFSI